MQVVHDVAPLCHGDGRGCPHASTRPRRPPGHHGHGYLAPAPAAAAAVPYVAACLVQGPSGSRPCTSRQPPVGALPQIRRAAWRPAGSRGGAHSAPASAHDRKAKWEYI
eukprot:365543-Chlamydomonas_euryale.AAC.6